MVAQMTSVPSPITWDDLLNMTGCIAIGPELVMVTISLRLLHGLPRVVEPSGQYVMQMN